MEEEKEEKEELEKEGIIGFDIFLALCCLFLESNSLYYPQCPIIKEEEEEDYNA